MKTLYKRSFTLVEMVTAMAILLLVAMILGTASAAFYNGYRRSLKTTERLKVYMAIDRIMDQCVRNAIPLRWTDDNREERFVFEGKTDSLLITSLRRSYDPDKGALLFVRLRVEDEKLLAEYSFYPRLPWEEEEKGLSSEGFTREILAENVSSITFLYAEQGSEEIEFVEEWVEDDHEAIPLAIQMTVEWKDGTRECWLRRTAGSAANTVFGNRQTSLSDGGTR